MALPRHYGARYDIRKWRDRRVDMGFVARDGAVVAERGKEDTSHKPQLAESFRRNVLDPISAVASIREALRRQPPKPGQQFTVPVYDGARRFDVAASVAAIGGEDGLIHLRLMLRPIAGFKGESSDEGDPDDAPRPADVTMTNDGRFLLELAQRVGGFPAVYRPPRSSLRELRGLRCRAMRAWLRDTLAPLLKIEWHQFDFRGALRCVPAVAATLALGWLTGHATAGAVATGGAMAVGFGAFALFLTCYVLLLFASGGVVLTTMATSRIVATLIGGLFAVGVHVHFQMRRGRWIVRGPPGETSGP